MEIEYDLNIILPAYAGKVYKKDLRNALNLTASQFLKSVHLMMNGQPDFKEAYGVYHKTAQAIPIKLAVQIAEHLYFEGKVVVKMG